MKCVVLEYKNTKSALLYKEFFRNIRGASKLELANELFVVIRINHFSYLKCHLISTVDSINTDS